MVLHRHLRRDGVDLGLFSLQGTPIWRSHPQSARRQARSAHTPALRCPAVSADNCLHVPSRLNDLGGAAIAHLAAMAGGRNRSGYVAGAVLGL